MISPKEEYPHPTFTPSEETYDRVEIEDSYVMLSGNRNSPPVHRQYSLLNGNEIKEDNAMDLNKIAGRFKRAWANAGRALNVKLPDVQAIIQVNHHCGHPPSPSGVIPSSLPGARRSTRRARHSPP